MYFDELKIGMTVEIPDAVIEKEKMVAFAHDYDNIPIHTDEEYAKISENVRCEIYVLPLNEASVFMEFLNNNTI